MFSLKKAKEYGYNIKSWLLYIGFLYGDLWQTFSFVIMSKAIVMTLIGTRRYKWPLKGKNNIQVDTIWMSCSSV